ncbi:DDE 1 domain containing protein, partial [Asbolus verrucosus]
MQPLDVGYYKPFSTAYNAAVDSWMMQHSGKPLSIYEVAECVGIAHEKALTPINIIHSFKKCGIYPFDADVFTDIDFL